MEANSSVFVVDKIGAKYFFIYLDICNVLIAPVKIFCDHNVITNHGRDHGRDTPFTVITPSAMRDWSDHTRDQGVITPLTVILYSDGVITYG